MIDKLPPQRQAADRHDHFIAGGLAAPDGGHRPRRARIYDRLIECSRPLYREQLPESHGAEKMEAIRKADE